jgi:hypothetical protein
MTDSNPPGAPPKKGKAVKPELVVHGFDLTLTARRLARLLAEKCDNLYVHDRRPVLVIPADDDSTPTIHPLTCNEVIIAAHKVCQPFKPKDGERPPVTLPDKVAELYLAVPDEWRLRELAGITTGPILHADGSIRTAPGYDPETRCLCCCNLTLTVPDKPSREDAERAFATLRHAFRTHAFADRVTVPEKFSIDGRSVTNDVVDLKQNPGKDESTYLGALLTAVARASLPLAPGFAWSAPDTSGSGAGKDLLVKAISTVALATANRVPSHPGILRRSSTKRSLLNFCAASRSSTCKTSMASRCNRQCSASRFSIGTRSYGSWVKARWGKMQRPSSPSPAMH